MNDLPVKRLLSLLLLSIALSATGQVDTNSIRHTYYYAMKLTEARIDSIEYYADYMQQIDQKGQYPAAKFMSLRLRGWYFENKANYPRAIDYYMQALDAARKLGYIEHQTEALADLAAVYTSDMKEPEKAKDIYQECVRLDRQLGDAGSLVTSYINLGAIYDRLGLYDSALLLLKEGLRIGKPLEAKGKYDLDDLYNNMGNTYYYLKEFAQSIVYFRDNYIHHLVSQSHPASPISGSMFSIWPIPIPKKEPLIPPPNMATWRYNSLDSWIRKARSRIVTRSSPNWPSAAATIKRPLSTRANGMRWTLHWSTARPTSR